MHSIFGKTVLRTLRVMAVAWAGLLVSLWLPSVNLDSSFAVWVVRWTNTGDVTWTVLIGLAFAGILIFRRAVPWRRRLLEVLIHLLVLALLQGGGALINEYLIKRSLAVPRPNIVWLAEEDALGTTPEQFYASMGTHARRAYLEEVLADSGFDAIALSDEVRDHWILETGYSLPSGHASSAMLLSTYFMAMGILFLGRRHCWIFYLLPLWAVVVGWSRVLLRVHRPEDVVLGGLQGVALGVVAIAVAYQLLSRLTPSTKSPPR
ncbi:phosphatase PAP2 family protein [Candidatus Bipolaricaulota bacterium]